MEPDLEKELFKCIREKYYFCIERLSKRVNVNIFERNKNRKTPLMLASYYGIYKAVKILLQAGADPNFGDVDSDSALILSLQYNSDKKASKIVKLLIEANANLNFQDREGLTALIYTAMKNNIISMKLLLEAGADANIQDRYGKTALIYACKENSLDAVELLINYSSDPNIIDRNYISPLMIAIKVENIEIVKLLLEAGADPNAVTEGNDSALISAIDSGSIEMISLLLSYGAQLNDYSIELAEYKGIDLGGLIDFNNFIAIIINTNPKNTFGENYSTLKPQYRRRFIKFIHDWADYCSNPHANLHPSYIKFIAQILGLKVSDLTEEQMCSSIKSALHDYLYQIENLDYSLFKDVDPLSREEFTEFRPIDLLQYGEPY